MCYCFVKVFFFVFAHVSIKCEWFLNGSIWPITGTTTPGLSGPGSNRNEEVESYCLLPEVPARRKVPMTQDSFLPLPIFFDFVILSPRWKWVNFISKESQKYSMIYFVFFFFFHLHLRYRWNRNRIGEQGRLGQSSLCWMLV